MIDPYCHLLRCRYAECSRRQLHAGALLRRYCDDCFARTAEHLAGDVDTSKELLTRIDGRDAAAAEHVARLLFAALIGIPDHRRGMWS